MTQSLESFLDGLSNFGGPINSDCRKRVRRALLRPSADAWDDAYPILVTPRYTAWQAVKAVDPECPESVQSADLTPAERWQGYFPDSFTLRRALEWATTQETNASSHG